MSLENKFEAKVPSREHIASAVDVLSKQSLSEDAVGTACLYTKYHKSHFPLYIAAAAYIDAACKHQCSHGNLLPPLSSRCHTHVTSIF
jgi:hypothetical protein